MAWPGVAGQGRSGGWQSSWFEAATPTHGVAWLGAARLGRAWQGVARRGVAKQGRELLHIGADDV